MTVSQILLALAAIALNALGARATPATTSECYSNTQLAGVQALETVAVDSTGFDSCTLGWSGSLSCGGGNAGTRPKDQRVLAMPEFDTSDCLNKYRWADKNAGNMALASEVYDTVKAFIQSCAMYEWSWSAFGWSNTAVDGLSQNSAYLVYRDWLKSVMFLNPADRYFCNDLGSIYFTFVRYIEPYKGHDYNGAIAVLDYIAHCGRCDSASYWDSRQSLRSQQWSSYRDTVRDSVTYPLDTTLPSLKDLGLDMLKVQQGQLTGRHDIMSFGITPNPVEATGAVEFQLSDIDVAELEVYDLLGTKVYSAPRSVYQTELQRISINVRSWVAGTYYVRLTTAHGDVRTLKLVKQ
jgi:hypothetical protein